MWWLALPVAGVVGKFVYDLVVDEDNVAVAGKSTTLELNMIRLAHELRGSSKRKLAIIGQPGAGKSSLLKSITNGMVRPLPVIGVETDATDWSSDLNCNLLSFWDDFCFSDVPGYDTLSHPISIFRSYFPVQEFDGFIYVFQGKFHSADVDMFRMIAKTGKRVCLARSFSDGLDCADFESVERDVRNQLSLLDFFPIFFFSNRSGDGVDSIFDYMIV